MLKNSRAVYRSAQQESIRFNPIHTTHPHNSAAKTDHDLAGFSPSTESLGVPFLRYR